MITLQAIAHNGRWYETIDKFKQVMSLAEYKRFVIPVSVNNLAAVKMPVYGRGLDCWYIRTNQND